MSKKLLVGSLVAVIGLTILMLGSCSKSHQPLNGVYYGYYDHNPDKNQFVILAFDKAHPKKVAIRKNLDDIKINGIFHVTYTANAVTIQSENSNFKLNISSNNHLLTCPSCDGKTMPRKYSIGMDKGKPFDPKVGGIAFDSILKDAKAHDGYQP